jgi:hypothetical protein
MRLWSGLAGGVIATALMATPAQASCGDTGCELVLEDTGYWDDTTGCADGTCGP